MHMLPVERRQKLREYIRQNGSATIGKLSEYFNVSPMTVHRDLRILEDEGYIRKTRGGALYRYETSRDLYQFEKSTALQLEQKRHIAQLAVQLLRPGDTIFINAGTTTYEFAKHIPPMDGDIAVITDSLKVAQVLANSPNVQLVMTGGEFRETTQAFVGPLANLTLENINGDIAFVGVNGISVDHGLTTPNILEANTNRRMIQSCNRAVVLADSTKFGKVTISKIASVEAVNAVITDPGVSVDYVDMLEECGIIVISCEKDLNKWEKVS